MKILSFLLIGIILLSCKKKEDRACWKVAGNQTSETIPLDDFSTLYLGAHIDYTIVQDTVNYMVIDGAENLINLVTHDVEGDKLKIENKNKCNFLRSFKKKGIHITLHFKDLVNLEYQGTEHLVSVGVLHLNYFTFLINEGSGPVDLNIQAIAVNGVINDGYGDFTLHGNADYADFQVSSNGYCNTTDFKVNNTLDVISGSPVKCRFNFEGATTRVEIKSAGDIEYIGTPFSIELLNYGTGKLIDGN